MVTATTNRGLSAADLTSIRSTLDAGRKPKVMFTESAGQIAGQLGQVVDLLDPASDEWVVVRFGRDELPFSPADLAIPPRGAAKRPAKPESPTTDEPTVDASAPDLPYEPIAYESIAAVPPQRQEVVTMSAESTVDAERSTEPTADAADDGKPARKATARQPKVKAPPTLTVTITYTDGEWMVAAQQGTKALAKPYVIKPTEALRMVALLDVPGVHEAVEQIVEAERAETQAHAERLRSQLAEIEARLAELPAAL